MRLAPLSSPISTTPVNVERRREIWFGGNHGDVGGGWMDDDETDKPYRRRQITLWYMLKQNHGLALIDNWEEKDDVMIDPTWRRCGKEHGGGDYRFMEDIGGTARRSPPSVPYDPLGHPEVLHPSASGK